MEHYSAIEKKEIMSFAGKWIELNYHQVEQDKPNSETYTSMFSFI
jgi:hypothetical protein